MDRLIEEILQKEDDVRALDSLVHDCHVHGRGEWDRAAQTYTLHFHRIGFEHPQERRHLFGLVRSTFYPCVPAQLTFTGVIECSHALKDETEFDQLGGARLTPPSGITLDRMYGQTTLTLARSASLRIHDIAAPLGEGHRFFFS